MSCYDYLYSQQSSAPSALLRDISFLQYILGLGSSEYREFIFSSERDCRCGLKICASTTQRFPAAGSISRKSRIISLSSDSLHIVYHTLYPLLLVDDDFFAFAPVVVVVDTLDVVAFEIAESVCSEAKSSRFRASRLSMSLL